MQICIKKTKREKTNCEITKIPFRRRRSRLPVVSLFPSRRSPKHRLLRLNLHHRRLHLSLPTDSPQPIIKYYCGGGELDLIVVGLSSFIHLNSSESVHANGGGGCGVCGGMKL